MDIDLLLQRVESAIELQQCGQRDAARQPFTDLWREIGPAGDPLCRCRLAHHMADLQDEPREELTWDLRALEAAGLLPSLPGFLAQVNLLPTTGLPPFLLHLYNYAWFVGFAIAFTVYLVLRKLAPNA